MHERYGHIDTDSDGFGRGVNPIIQRAMATSQRQFFAGALDGTSGSLIVSTVDSILHFHRSTFHDLINVAFISGVLSA